MRYREIFPAQINPALFSSFIRRQAVTQCMRNVNGVLCAHPIAFIDDWTAEDILALCGCLHTTLAQGGIVLGAFDASEALKGFASVEGPLIGSHAQYADLTCLHVSADLRGQGVGRVLFTRACAWARSRGAQKLYISAHSAVETQAFYRAMGCVEAQEYSPAHVQAEPCDCQMERML